MRIPLRPQPFRATKFVALKKGKASAHSSKESKMYNVGLQQAIRDNLKSWFSQNPDSVEYIIPPGSSIVLSRVSML